MSTKHIEPSLNEMWNIIQKQERQIAALQSKRPRARGFRRTVITLGTMSVALAVSGIAFASVRFPMTWSKAARTKPTR